jgi:hypothetical protein
MHDKNAIILYSLCILPWNSLPMGLNDEMNECIGIFMTCFSLQCLIDNEEKRDGDLIVHFFVGNFGSHTKAFKIMIQELESGSLLGYSLPTVQH